MLDYWQTARVTKVSVPQGPSAGFGRERQIRAEHLCVEATSRPRPELKPFALQSASAAGPQSGAPFAAGAQSWRPVIIWPTGKPTIAPVVCWAAPAAPLSASVACAPIPPIASCVFFSCESSVARESPIHRPSASMKPGAKLGLGAGPGAGAVVSAASLGTSGRASCATAPPAKGSRKASAPTRAHDNAVVHQTRLVDLLSNPLIPPPRSQAQRTALHRLGVGHGENEESGQKM